MSPGPVRLREGDLALRVFLDDSIVEVFPEGHPTVTTRVYGLADPVLRLSSRAAAFRDVRVHTLEA